MNGSNVLNMRIRFKIYLSNVMSSPIVSESVILNLATTMI